MKDYIDLTNISKKYKGSWITLDKSLKNVLSFDKDAKKAYDKAVKKGFNKPTLFKVPKEIVPYFGLLSYDKVQI